ncbi:MAG: hypothetical protein SGBAC_003309 [Bacillariaceae sp.]
MAQISYLRHRQLVEGDSTTFKPFEDNDDMWILICSVGVGVSALFLLVRICADCFMVEGGHTIKRSTVSARMEEQEKARKAKNTKKQRKAQATEAKKIHKQEKKQRKKQMKGGTIRGVGKGKRPPPPPDQGSNRRRIPSKSSEDFSADSGKPMVKRRPSRASSHDSTELISPPRRQASRSKSAEPNKLRKTSSKSRPRKNSEDSTEIISPPRRQASRSRSGSTELSKTQSKKGKRPSNDSDGDYVSGPPRRQVSKPGPSLDDDDSAVSDMSDDSSDYVSGPPRQQFDDEDSDDSGDYVSGPPPGQPATSAVPYARPEPKASGAITPTRRPSVSSSSEESLEPSSDASFEEMPPRPVVKKNAPKKSVPNRSPTRNGQGQGLINNNAKRKVGSNNNAKKVAVKGFLGSGG